MGEGIPKEPLHIGDGVYVQFDGFNVWLSANHPANRVVALDPHVFDALIQYRADLKAAFIAAGHDPRGILG